MKLQSHVSNSLSPCSSSRACCRGCIKGPEGLLQRDIGVDVDIDIEADVDKDRYFGCSKRVSKSVQVLWNCIEQHGTYFLLILQ